MSNKLVEHLNTYSEADWLSAVNELLSEIHPVDRNAVQIWFRFYPLELRRYIEQNAQNEDVVRGLALKGEYSLDNGIDTSHHFLYGHRYWPTVKRKTEKLAEEFSDQSGNLSDLVRDVGMRAAEKLGVERQLVNAIAAVALATLNQVGLDSFKEAKGEAGEPTGLMKRSPDVIVAEREKDDSQGIFGFLRTVDKKFSVAFAANGYSGKFPIINEEEVVSAAQKDHSQNWQAHDERCWEGPIPVECTAASCGTCWVGILGGQEKLDEVKRRERRQMKVFGYDQPEDERPFLRLACQTRATGNLTIVIPPWNGVFGKKVYGNVEEIELEPNTTSAKALRETIKTATSGN